MIIVLSLSGCGQKSPFPVEPVEGTITLDGVAIEGATISFSPKTPEGGKPAAGRTNAHGIYKLTAFSGGLPEKGTMIGSYNVTVVLDRREREITPEEAEILRNGGRIQEIPTINVVPRKYNSSATSGLSAEVIKGKNVFDFDLTTAR